MFPPSEPARHLELRAQLLEAPRLLTVLSSPQPLARRSRRFTYRRATLGCFRRRRPKSELPR